MSVKIAVLLLALVCCARDVRCCDCGGRGRLTLLEYNTTDWIFVGQLIGERRDSSHTFLFNRAASYRVDIAYKGVHEGDTVVVFDAEYTDACGLGTLRSGRSYLVYASGDEKKWTSGCSRITLVPGPAWWTDSRRIRSLADLHSFGPVHDTIFTNFYADTIFLNRHLGSVRNGRFKKYYDESGMISAEGGYKSGLPDGFWKYFLNGKVVRAGKYAGGKKDSLWVEPSWDDFVSVNEYRSGEYTYRYRSYLQGRLFSEVKVIYGGRKWVAYIYHKNGKPKLIVHENPAVPDENGKFNAPLADGPSKAYSENGILLEDGAYENGLRNGHWRRCYENGKLRIEGNYEHGKKSGTWKIYHPNRRIKAVGTYHNGEKAADWKYFNEKGAEILPNPDFTREIDDF